MIPALSIAGGVDLPDFPTVPDYPEDAQYPETPADFFALYPDATPYESPFPGWDVDGDTADDFFLPLPGWDPDEPFTGSIELLSGWDGDFLGSVSGTQPNDLFGIEYVAIGDVDGDGVNDFAVGAPASDGLDGLAPNSGMVKVFSGASYSPLYTITSPVQEGGLGLRILAMGDIDSDGLGDFAVAAPAGEDNPGYVWIFTSSTLPPAPAELSGPDAAVSHVGAETGDAFGFSLALLNDFDGDGVFDYVIGAPYAERADPSDPTSPGAVTIFSGATNQAITKIVGAQPEMFLGFSAIEVGDLNGDGLSDLLVGGAGHVFVEPGNLSVENGDEVYVFYGGATAPATQSTNDADLVIAAPAASDGLFGMGAGNLRDADGDGVDDFWIDSVAMTLDGAELALEPLMSVFSGVDGSHLFTLAEDDPFPFVYPPGFGDPLPAAAMAPPAPPQEGGILRSGDLDANGSVDAADVGLLLLRFGQSSASAAMGDLNGDGVISDLDLTLLLANYGLSQPVDKSKADIDGDGLVRWTDVSLLVAATEATSPIKSLDLDGDGINTINDVVIAALLSDDGIDKEICVELDGLLTPDDEEQLCGPPVDGPIDPPDFPCCDGSGENCDDLPQDTLEDCEEYAECVADNMFGDQIEDLVEQFDDLRVEVIDLLGQYGDLGSPDHPLNAAVIQATAAVGAQKRAAERQVGNTYRRKLGQIERRSIAIGAAGGAAGGLTGAGIKVRSGAGAGGVLFGGIIGAIVGVVVIDGITTTIDLLEFGEDLNADLAAIDAAARGVPGIAGVPPGLVIAGDNWAAAVTEYNQANDALFAELQDKIEELIEKADALDDAREQRDTLEETTRMDCENSLDQQ